MYKVELREDFITKRKNMTADEVQEKSQVISIILEDFFKHLVIQTGEPKKVMTYIAHGNEVDLASLHRSLWKMGFILCVPVTEGLPAGEMVAVEYTAETILEPCSFGILEPVEKNIIEPNDIDVVLVPGVAFDKFGNRLGHGAGYYDNYMEGFDFLRLGVAYLDQVMEKMDSEPHDVKMDGLICEKGSFRL